MIEKALIIIAIFAVVLSLFLFFYRIEYGDMSKEEKEKRLERFEKYGW